MEDRIVFDAGALVRNMEVFLDGLKRFQYDTQYHMLFGEAFISKLAAWDRNIRARKDDPFTLVVCGDFKRGKSSLINALLGEEVVTTDVTTETVSVNRISYGSHLNEAVLRGGRKIILSDEELRKNKLKPLMEESGEAITHLNIVRPLELLKNVVIVDTPGLGDAFEDFSELVGDALVQADAVIYVFAVNYPLSQHEQMFLKTAILPQGYTELFLVGNFCDTLGSEDDLRRMETMIQKRIQNLLPDQRPFFLSALDESCRLLGAERPNESLQDVLENNFSVLRGKLQSLVEDKKDFVLPDRMGRLLSLMKADIEYTLSAIEKGLTMDQQSIREALDRLNEEKDRQIQVQAEAESIIADLVKKMKAEALTWMDELINRMRDEMETLSGTDATILTKYYSFYCIDLLQQGIECCMETHQNVLYEALEDISSQLVKALGQLQEQSPYAFRFALDNKSWTKGDNVSYVINRVMGAGLLSLVADGFAGSMRQKEMAKKTPDVLASIRRQYSGVYSSVQAMVEKSYSNMEETVKKQLQSYYRDKIESAQALVEQSAMVVGQNEENKRKIEAAVMDVRNALYQLENIV